MNSGTRRGDDGGDPRVLLAIERTFLAWTRTALALMAFGFLVGRVGILLRDLAGADGGPAASGAAMAQSSQSLWLGVALVVLGIVVEGFALAEHRQAVRRFRRGEAIGSRGWSCRYSWALRWLGLASRSSPI